MTKSAKSVLAIRCSQCGQTSTMQLNNWRCDLCGGTWLPENEKKLELNRINTSAHDIWRYSEWMGFKLDEAVNLGAGGTPLVETKFQGHRVFLKTEYQNPSGSFKDRGVEAMLSALGELGAERVVEDSSGNAGASVAAYAARAGIKAEIFAPETASAFKLAQIELYGAKVNRIPGPRENSTRAVMEAVQAGAVFASHAWNPAYLLGQQTAAWEVWEQLGRRVPHWWVTPSGQGGHLMGIWLGFQRLFQSGLTDHLPRMVLVQSAAVAPLAMAIQKGVEKIEPMPAGKRTLAEGVVVTNPVRWKQILTTARENDWLGISIAEEEILPARLDLAHGGFFVEPTSALAAAALPKLYPFTHADDLIVVSLTGSGLKSLLLDSNYPNGIQMTDTDIIAFTRGIPAPETFPAEQLAACAREVLLEEGRQVLQYGQASGYKPLREILAKQFGVEIERVLLGQGSLQLFDHVIRLLVKPGDAVLVEQPTYDRSLTLLRRSGAKLIGIDLAEDGISLEQLERVLVSGSRPLLFYTIPDFQNPTGRVMSLEKRQGLLRLANQIGFLVVEDAPYRRLRYSGDELPSLFELDPQNVLHLSSFSKLISPGLRVGYAILPVKIAEKVINFAEDTYINPPFSNQALVQHYIQHGWLEPHLKTIQELYSQRLSALLATLEENIQGKGSWIKPEGGFFLGFYPKKKMEVEWLLQAANQAGVRLSDGRGFFVQGGDDFIRLPFCALPPQEIRIGIQRLAGIL